MTDEDAVRVSRTGVVTLGSEVVGGVAREWLRGVGYLWVSRDAAGQRVGTGATRREAVAELLAARA